MPSPGFYQPSDVRYRCSGGLSCESFNRPLLCRSYVSSPPCWWPMNCLRAKCTIAKALIASSL